MANYTEDQKKKCAGWLFVGMLPQFIQQHGQTAGTALKVIGAAEQAVEELDQAGKLDSLMAAFECSRNVK